MKNIHEFDVFNIFKAIKQAKQQMQPQLDEISNTIEELAMDYMDDGYFFYLTLCFNGSSILISKWGPLTSMDHKKTFSGNYIDCYLLNLSQKINSDLEPPTYSRHLKMVSPRSSDSTRIIPISTLTADESISRIEEFGLFYKLTIVCDVSNDTSGVLRSIIERLSQIFSIEVLGQIDKYTTKSISVFKTI